MFTLYIMYFLRCKFCDTKAILPVLQQDELLTFINKSLTRYLITRGRGQTFLPGVGKMFLGGAYANKKKTTSLDIKLETADIKWL